MSGIDEAKFNLVPNCLICDGKLHEIDANKFACDDCKRIWSQTQEGWESEVRQVRMVKQPKVGDNLDDIIKPV